jgi:gas vesicle protein
MLNMQTNKAFLMAILIAGIIGSAYGMGKVEKIGEKAKQASENVRKVNEVIRDTDETVEGAGSAKQGAKDVVKDTGDVAGIDTSRPAQNSGQTAPAAQSGGGSAGIAGTWEDKSGFSPSRFEFTPDRYAYYRGRD